MKTQIVSSYDLFGVPLEDVIDFLSDLRVDLGDDAVLNLDVNGGEVNITVGFPGDDIELELNIDDEEEFEDS